MYSRTHLFALKWRFHSRVLTYCVCDLQCSSGTTEFFTKFLDRAFSTGLILLIFFVETAKNEGKKIDRKSRSLCIIAKKRKRNS
jgi:hypothetical protein